MSPGPHGTTLSVAEIAERLGGALEGDATPRISGVAGLREARPGQLSYLSSARYAHDVEQTQASAVLVAMDWRGAFRGALIRVPVPELAMEQVAAWLALPAALPDPGVHPTAVVAPSARLGADVRIGALCVVEADAEIGAACVIFAGCYVGSRCRIGDNCRFYPHVSLREDVVVGNRVIIHNGTVVGSDGYGYRVEMQDGKPNVHKVPQLGTVVIGDDAEIGANVTIDRARFGATRIGNSVKIDNLVQIAHNVIIGDHCGIIAQTGISGSTVVGPGSILYGQVGVAGHLTIGPGVVVGAQGGVTKDIPAGTRVWGTPARPMDQVAESLAHVARLPELKRRVKELEERLAALERAGACAKSGGET